MAMLKPLKVSPFIKCARYSFLLFGILYGLKRRAFLEVYDKKQALKRQKRIEEYKRRDREESFKNLTKFCYDVARDFNIKLPPGWKPPVH